MAYDYITKYNFPGHTAGKWVASVFGQGPRVIQVDIIHWWGLPSWGQTLHGVCTFFEGQPSNGTGAHYVVTAGTVACGIAEANASHANGHSWANAHSVTWECNPNARDGDYDTLAEALADCWIARGYTKPGLIAGHNDYTATQCPGDYALDRVRREAAAWFHAKRSGTVKPAAANAPKPIQEDDMPSAKEVAEENWDVEIGLGKDKYQTGSYLLWTHNNTGKILDRISAQNAQIEGLAGAVVALSKGEKLDVDKLLAGVEAAAKRGVESGFESVTRTETVTAKVK